MKKMNIIVVLILGTLLTACGTTQLKNTNSKNLPKDAKKFKKDLKVIIEKKIDNQIKKCPKEMSIQKCKQLATIYVESHVWANILDSKWKITKAFVYEGYLFIRIERGKDAPLVGEINIGKFNHIESASYSGGTLEIKYKKETASFKTKASWFGGGAGFGFLLGLLILL